MDSKYLKLTKIDDTVYSEYQQLFKDFQCEIIDVDELKSAKSKEVLNIILFFKEYLKNNLFLQFIY